MSKCRQTASLRRSPSRPEARRSDTRLMEPAAHLSQAAGGTSLSCPCGGGCPRCRDGNSGVQRVLASSGRPLPAGIRTEAEADFHHDFGAVRLHDDAEANASARAINARAYTVGSHIAFSSGAFAPDHEDGRRLLRHELTHVIQQKHSGPAPDSHSEIAILPRDHPTETEAHRTGSAAQMRADRRLPPGAWLQRLPDDMPDVGPQIPRTLPLAGGSPPATDAGQKPDAGQTQDAGVAKDQSDAGQLDTSKGSSGKVDLSPRDSTAGMIERLFMAEARTPLQESSYDEDDSLKCMRATGACIVNRKNDAKHRWPKTIDGVVKQKNQFQGFDSYPNYGEAQRQHNIEILKWANQKSKFQDDCRTFVNNAKKIAADTIAEKVADPFSKGGGTYGMRTAGSSSPGGGFKKVGTYGGNDFYTVT